MNWSLGSPGFHLRKGKCLLTSSFMDKVEMFLNIKHLGERLTFSLGYEG